MGTGAAVVGGGIVTAVASVVSGGFCVIGSGACGEHPSAIKNIISMDADIIILFDI